MAWAAFAQPLRRPAPKVRDSMSRDCFLMDFENAALEGIYNEPLFMCAKHAPKGKTRFEIDWWAAEIKKHVYPRHSDVDWYEYVEWVSNGGGDFCFLDILGGHMHRRCVSEAHIGHAG
jgi:hypothetical protein